MRVRVLKQYNQTSPVSKMKDEELNLELVVHRCGGHGGMLSPDEIASLRKAVSLKV